MRYFAFDTYTVFFAQGYGKKTKKQFSRWKTAVTCLMLFRRLLTETKSLNDSTVAVDVLSLEVREEAATLTYELYKGTVC